MVKVQENQYSATLTIKNIQSGEVNSEHFLRVTQGNSENAKVHRYVLRKKLRLEGDL